MAASRQKKKRANMEAKVPHSSGPADVAVLPAGRFSVPDKTEHAINLLRMGMEGETSKAWTDLIFVCQGGATVRAHTAIVTLASPVLMKLIKEQGCLCLTSLKVWIANFRGSKKAQRSLEACSCLLNQTDRSVFIPDVAEEALRLLLECIYSGTSNRVFNSNMAKEVTDAAELLGVKGLEVASSFSDANANSVANTTEADTVDQANTEKINGLARSPSAETKTRDKALDNNSVMNGVCSTKEKRRFVISSSADAKRRKLNGVPAAVTAPSENPSRREGVAEEGAVSEPAEPNSGITECPTCGIEVTFLSRDEFLCHLISSHHKDILQAALSSSGDCVECVAHSKEHSKTGAMAVTSFTHLSHLAAEHDRLREDLSEAENAALDSFQQKRLPDDSELLRDASLVRCAKSQSSSLAPALQTAAQLADGLGQRLQAISDQTPFLCPVCNISVGRAKLVQHLTKHLLVKILFVYRLHGHTVCSICGDAMRSTSDLVVHYAVQHKKIIDAAGLDKSLEKHIFIN